MKRLTSTVAGVLAICLVLFALTPAVHAAKPIRVLIWDEQQPEQKQAYGGVNLGHAIAEHLSAQQGIEVQVVGLESPEQGLADATLDRTDVVIWWAHKRLLEVSDENARRVADRVVAGKLAFIALHSAHWAKPFVLLMQERAKADARTMIPDAQRATTKLRLLNENPIRKMVRPDTPLTPSLRQVDGEWHLTLPQCVFPSWRVDGLPSHVTTLLPAHPIAQGLPERWDIPQTEMYSEPFHVPAPDAVVFEEKWDKGEHFRSGCVWNVGKGRVFYFRPGHETYPTYRQPEPLRVIDNAVRWLGEKPMPRDPLEAEATPR